MIANSPVITVLKVCQQECIGSTPVSLGVKLKVHYHLKRNYKSKAQLQLITDKLHCVRANRLPLRWLSSSHLLKMQLDAFLIAN